MLGSHTNDNDKLEKLIPSKELCEKIPADAFQDSVFVRVVVGSWGCITVQRVARILLSGV